MSADGPESPENFIRGDFYAGAYGPTIILVLASVDACEYLHAVLLSLATEETASFVLTDDRRVRIQNIGSLKLSRVPDSAEVVLRRSNASHPPSFDWAASASAWELSAGLLEPFCAGEAGHQYLTREHIDDALIEVSFGEHIEIPFG